VQGRRTETTEIQKGGKRWDFAIKGKEGKEKPVWQQRIPNQGYSPWKGILLIGPNGKCLGQSPVTVLGVVANGRKTGKREKAKLRRAFSRGN